MRFDWGAVRPGSVSELAGTLNQRMKGLAVLLSGFRLGTDGDPVFSRPVGVQGTTAKIYGGTGTPEGAVSAAPGSLFLRTDGGAGTTLYVKESGTGLNTGWVAK